ncbi:MAG: hypothetical protein ABI680_21145 [Chthoniobacteraceae bacterium]
MIHLRGRELQTGADGLGYSGRHSFFAYDRSRPVWSLFWSTPIALLCLLQLGYATFGLLHLQFLELGHNALLAYLLLSIRSSLVAYVPRFSPTRNGTDMRCI